MRWASVIFHLQGFTWRLWNPSFCVSPKRKHTFFSPLNFSKMCQNCLEFSLYFSQILFYRPHKRHVFLQNASSCITFIFPFLSLSRRLQDVHFKAPVCDAKRDEVLFLDGDFSSASRFFLTVGVFSFLYSLLATVIYVFYQNKYLKNNRGPLVVSGFNPSANLPLMSLRK